MVGHDSRQDILFTAARLFQEKGYDATSMQDVASSLDLSKAALYHHFESKDEILFQIMNYGMDIFENQVVTVVKGIADPEERLRSCIRLHIEVVVSGREREITVILHENHALRPEEKRQINARKKAYIVFLQNLIAEVQHRHGGRFAVRPKVAAFALLGMINWMYQWWRPEGEVSGQEMAQEYTALFLQGILAK